MGWPEATLNEDRMGSEALLMGNLAPLRVKLVILFTISPIKSLHFC